MLGSSNVAWLSHGVEAGLVRLARVRHEETAISAASGYGRANHSVGVCSVAAGPGFANSINAMIAATRSHMPVLLIVGESPATKKRTSQDIDQRSFSELIGCGFHHVADVQDLAHQYRRALDDAHWNGVPQVLSIGDGVLESEVMISSASPEPVVRESDPSQDAVCAAVDALAAAQRPLILAGQGAVLADCRQPLLELARLTGARTATTLRANRFFSSFEHDLGLCGSWSPSLVRERLAEIDVVLAVGTSLDRHTTQDRQVFAGAKVIHCEIDIEQPFGASSPELALVGDARRTADALLNEWRRRGVSPHPPPTPSPTWAEIRDAVCAPVRTSSVGSGLDAREVYAVLDDRFSPDRLVVTDLGRHLETLPVLLNARDAHSWHVGRGYGSIGLGLGIALGTATAAVEQDRQAILVCGDGGFMMAAQDLDAFRLNGSGLTVCIMNDEQYGSDMRYLGPHKLRREVARQTMPDVPKLAAAFGGTGHVIRTLDELAEVPLQEHAGGLLLLDIRIDPDTNAAGYW